MGNPNLQQREKERRGEKVLRGRSLQNSYPGRNTSNPQRVHVFTGAPEDSKGLRGSTSNQKQIPKTSRQQEVITSEGLNIPRCTSPVPFKQTTPQLNLQIPGPQTRNQYQRQNPPALIGPVKIMKRHTSPYPTPASSPNALMDKHSSPRRSDTCPAPVLDLTEKYKEKMHMFLKSDLISKVVDPSQGSRLEGDAIDREPAPENGMEANPVPDFFVNPTHVQFATRNEFENTWMSAIGVDMNPECDLMNTDYIGTLGSVQDLDEDMKDFLPAPIYSEYFPEPEVPLHKVSTPIVTLQNMDSDSVTGPVEIQRSGTTVAPTRLREDTENVGWKEGKQFLNTPQSLNHSFCSSGAVSPLPAGRQLFPTVMGEAVQGNSAMSNKKPASGSLDYPFGDVEIGLGNMLCGAKQPYIVGELTPPNSAHLSPSPSSASFLSKGSPTLLQAKKRLAPGSIDTIVSSILDPIMKNPELQDFRGLCNDAKEKMLGGDIGSLKDLESMFLTTRGRTISSSSELYKKFAYASLEGIQQAAARIPECDLRRSYDPVYDTSYFTDKFHEVKQVCAENEKRMAENAMNWEDMHGEQKQRDEAPMQQGKAEIAQQSQHRPQKRRLSSSRDTLPPTAKRSMITSVSADLLAGAPTSDRQQHWPFTKPTAQQKQQLGIQTQLWNSPNPYSHPQPYLQQQNIPVTSSSFMFDQMTGNVVTQIQSHNHHTYRDVGSEIIPSLATLPFAAPIGMVSGRVYQPPTPVSAISVPSTGLVSRTPTSTTRIAGSTASRSKGPGPLSTPTTKEDASTFPCELCDKRFPRPCDLTKHKKTHERPFKCDIESCKYHLEGFPTNKERERHQNDIHAPDSKEWKCEFSPCQYKSKRESNCKQHMEKAHQYVYRRMKRNPRRRDQGMQVAPQAPRRRRNAQPAQQSPVTPLRASIERSRSTALPQPQLRQSRASCTSPGQNPFARSFGPIQQPLVSNTENLNLLEPSQMQEINDRLLSRSMGDHAMNMSQSFYENSSVTAAEYGQSPVTVPGGVFGDYSGALRGHPDVSPTLASESFFQTQSAEEFVEDFLSDFPNGDNSFGIAQSSYQQTVGDFHFTSPGFVENLDCEREGHTPD